MKKYCSKFTGMQQLSSKKLGKQLSDWNRAFTEFEDEKKHYALRYRDWSYVEPLQSATLFAHRLATSNTI